MDPLEVRRLPGRHPGSRRRCGGLPPAGRREVADHRATRGARIRPVAATRPRCARFARIMLRQSQASAGAYTATLTATATDVGGTVAVTLSVTDGHGRPAAGPPGHAARCRGPRPSTRSPVTTDAPWPGSPAHARGWQDVSADGEPGARAPPPRAAAEKRRSGLGGRGRCPPDARGQREGRGTRSAVAVAGGVTRDLTVGAPRRGSWPLSTGDGVRAPATATLHGPFAVAGGCATAPGAVAATVEPVVGATATTPAAGRARGRRLLRLARRCRRHGHQSAGRRVRGDREGPGPRDRRTSRAPATAAVYDVARRRSPSPGCRSAVRSTSRPRSTAPTSGRGRLHGQPSQTSPNSRPGNGDVHVSELPGGPSQGGTPGAPRCPRRPLAGVDLGVRGVGDPDPGQRK